MMKRFFVVLLSVLFVGVTLLSNFGLKAEAASVTYKAKVTTSSLNVREKLGTSSKSLGLVKKGTVLDVYGTYTYKSEKWYKVKYKTKYGYVHGKYVSLTKVTKPVSKATVSKPVSVATTTDNVNVRETASSSSKSFGVAKKGSKLDVYGTATVGKVKWYKVKFGTKFGYVHGGFVKLASVAPAPVKPPVASNTVVKPVMVGTITENDLNVRAWPSTISKVVGQVGRGANVDIYGTNVVDGDTWYKIKYGTDYAFVFAAFVKTAPYGSAYPTLATLALKGKVIVLDAGHGGTDPGAVGNGIYEKNIVLDSVARTAALLKAQGATVVLSRPDDVFKTLDQRVTFANNSGAHLFISFHANAGASSASGIETWHSVNKASNVSQGRELAYDIQNRMIAATGAVNRGVKSGDFYVIKYTKMPSVLLELGFITNASDASKMNTASYRQTLATAVTNGVLDYFK